MSDTPTPQVELRGVATNNLKSIDCSFPIGQITVVTGVSGSGKSSLVFDTLYGEAYRRYVESLSSFARQYMKALPKPDVAEVENLPPAIAVRQGQSVATSRSTVGTATELTDLLRILFAHLSTIHCVRCGQPIRRDHPESVATEALAELAGKKVLVAAPLERWGKVQVKELKAQLEAQGFTRIMTAGAGEKKPAVLKLTDAKAADLKGASVIVDRLTLSAEGAGRFKESLQLGFKVGRGQLVLLEEGGDLAAERKYSQGLDCPRCGLEYLEPSTALLSFNHPLGACSTCQGFGYAAELDFDKIVPKRDKSLAEQGVAPWNFGKFAEYYSWAKTSAKRNGVPFDLKFSEYSESQWQWLLNGEGREFDGILGFFAYLDSKKYKAHYRIHASRFRKYELCTVCHGNRLNEKALACKLQGLNIAEACDLSIGALNGWLEKLAGDPHAPSESGVLGVVEALEEARARLKFLLKIGVAYLTLNRPSRTLSGGELQRINMARCLGSALTDTLFCLDEPSAGLHARDSANLLEVIRELRDQGNTVVLVEHERRLIAGADHLIEIGPLAGHEGGRVVRAGPPTDYAPVVLPGRAPLPAPTRFIELKGAKTHNLKDIDVKIPVGRITAVCGVSGSGKTSLIQHTFYPLVAKALGQPSDRAAALRPVAASIGPTAVIKEHGEVMLVSQAGLGRSTRSNIATYLGIMDEIRKLFAAEPMATKLGLTPGSFSFNTAGGRCETCRGLGQVVEDLSFLGEMSITCPACNGRRFGDTVLAIELRGKNLTELLKLTVSEARAFFFDRPAVVRACDAVIGMGMGYITLGQGTNSFSGGEAQRLKLLNLMREVRETTPQILIFDEPTTGLSDADVLHLLVQLRGLADRGHTLIVVEHHLGVLRFADWLIEIGPEAAAEGGTLVYQGPPEGLAAAANSVTRPFLIGSKH